MTVTKNRFSVSSSEKYFEDCTLRITYGLTHSTRYRTDGPTKCIEVVPRPFAAIDLLAQLVEKNLLHIHDIQVCEINEQLSHDLVDDYNLDFSHGLSHDFAFIVLHNKHLQGVRLHVLKQPVQTYLFRLGHSLHHDQSQVRQDLRIDIFPQHKSAEYGVSTRSAEAQAHE